MWKRIILGTTCALFLVVGGAATYLVLRKPASAPPRDIRVVANTEQIERGRYLFHTQFECIGCHSARDYSRFGAPVKPEGIGQGAVMPDQLGFPGRVVVPNITPDKETGIGNWTDGEILRAIREGVDREGNALFPFMPYVAYSKMSDQDAEAIVAYMRNLPAVRNPLPETDLALPVALMIKSVPQPLAGAVPHPKREISAAYGEYLVRVGDCAGCHTPQERGAPLDGMDLAGGFALHFPEGRVVGANITPDMETGLGSWTEDGFVSRFKQYQEMARSGPPAVTRETFTIMPWLAYSELDEVELRSMYRYLRTVKPVRNKVIVHPDAQIALR